MKTASRHQKLLSVLACVAGLAGVGDHAAAAPIFDFTNFTSTSCDGSQLTCVGITQVVGNALRLSPAQPGYGSGAAYSTQALTLGAGATFSTTFQFRFTNPGGIDPADGIVFVLSNSTTGLGGAGYGIGYAGLQGKSIGIEFDTFNNFGYENSSNHVAVDLNGDLTNAATANPYGVGTCELAANSYQQAGCMANGDIWSVTIGYDGTTHLLNVVVQDGSAPAQTIISNYQYDIAGDLGSDTAYVGFTSATGSGWENHDLLNWQLASDIGLANPPPTTDVPEPLPLGLGAIGVVAMLLTRRRASSGARR